MGVSNSVQGMVERRVESVPPAKGVVGFARVLVVSINMYGQPAEFNGERLYEGGDGIDNKYRSRRTVYDLPKTYAG